MPSPSSSPRSRATSALMGQMAESFVATWLVNRGWRVVQRRWRCRWGELDLVMERSPQPQPGQPARPPILAFVEVKARRRGNWDQDGLLAITPQKQAKLWQAAQLFLVASPQMAHHICRFDVALVSCQAHPQAHAAEGADPVLLAPDQLVLPPALQLGQPVVISPYRLTIQQYLPGAFQPEE